jgi:hypothetical protein
VSYDPGRELSQEELSLPTPEGFSASDPALIRLWLTIHGCLTPAGIKIRAVRQHRFQEQYDIADRSGNEATIAIVYNGKREVTSLKVLRGDATFGERSIEMLCSGEEASDPVAKHVLALLRVRLSEHELNVLGIKESKYLLRVTIGDCGSSRALVDVHFDGRGMVTSVIPVKATSQEFVS